MSIIQYNNLSIFRWDKLFEILTKSSPNSLFKFKFFSSNEIELEYLKLFFDNWKDRNPILLKLSTKEKQQLEDLTEKYKTKGIIKTYNVNDYFEDFEWIQKMN